MTTARVWVEIGAAVIACALGARIFRRMRRARRGLNRLLAQHVYEPEEPRRV